MPKTIDASDAEALYKEGMKYNWAQGKTPAGATLARANLERAADLGHVKAIGALADMMFEGSGGGKNQEHAMWLKWQAFIRGDHEALEELSTLLDSYSENKSVSPNIRKAAFEAAGRTDEVVERLNSVRRFLADLAQIKLSDDSH